MAPGAFCVNGIEMETEQLRGLYLVPPHGELIATGAKSAVVKSKYVPGHRLFDLRGDWMLVSKVDGVGLGLGGMTLGEPVERSLEDFDTKESEHRVSRVDRLRWWPECETLWEYPIEGFKGYDEALRVDVPAGVQTVMSSVMRQAVDPGSPTTADKAYSGVAIALAVPPSVAKKLAVKGEAYEGGEGQGVIPLDQLHLTLAYLGDAKELEEKRGLLQEGVAAFAVNNQRISGEIKGRVIFDTPNGSAVCAHFDSPELPDFRQRFITFLDNLGFEPQGDHGFTPHICLAYVEPGQEVEVETPTVPNVTLDELSVLWAGDQTDYQLKAHGTKATSQPFIIFQRTWSHTPVKAYDLFIKAGGGKVWNFESPDNLLKGGKRRGVPLETSRKIEITDLEDKDHNIWSLESGDKIQVKDGSQFNPTVTHKCIVKVLDTGKAALVKKKSDFRQYDFDGAKVKGLQDFELHDAEANVWLMHEPTKGAEKETEVDSAKETDMQEITVLLDDEQLEDEKVYSKLSDANPALRGIKPPIDLKQANLIASWADAIESGEEDGPESPWGVAIAQFKRLYEIEGDAWIERAKDDSKATWSGAYIGKLPDTAFLLIESGGEKKDGITRPLSLRHLPVRGKDGEIDVPHLRNALARMSQMKDKEGKRFPAAAIEKLREKARKLLAESKKAQPDYCICEKCDHVTEHKGSTSCNETGCKECDGTMKDATQAEIEAAGVQAGRAVVAAVATGVDAAIKEEGEGGIGTSAKEGRRVRQDKVGLLRRLKDELNEFLVSLGEFIGWATYDDKPKDSEPEEFDLSTLLSIAGKKALEQGSTAFAFKALDGQTWWFQWTTNAFEDHEGEIFTTKTIEDYVTRNENRDVKGEFWFWHTLGSKFGTVRLQAIVGRFLAQTGPFDDTAVGRAFKEFFSEYPHSHPDIAPEGWGTSHGYSYRSTDREDGVYEWFDIKESTVLPGRFASNPYSPMPQILQEVKKMNPEQRKAFAAVGGEEFVDLIMNIGKESTKKLEDEGVAFKEVTPEQDSKAGGNYVARIKEIAKTITDEGLKGQVEVFCAKLEKATPAAEKEADEAEEVEDEKAKTDMASLAGQLRMLAGKVGGDAGGKLTAIAEEMAQASGKKEDAETTTKVKTVEPETEATDILTREEVADALKAVIEVLRDEIKESTETTVAGIAEALKPLVAEVKSLKEADEVKVAQKAAETPAASLSSLLQSVIGNPATLVEAGSKLAASGPKETASLAANVTGIPFVDTFIGGTDQPTAGGN